MMRSFLVVFAFLVCLSSGAWAQSFDKQSSIDYIKGLSEKVVLIAKKEQDKKNQDDQVATLLNENLAYERIARFVLGKHWLNATEGEKKEFLDLYAKSLRLAYSRQILSVDLKDVQVYDAFVSPRGQLITVKTKVTDPGSGQPVAIDWRLISSAEGYKIVDVLVEGISVASSQRSEYASIIQRGGGKVEAVLAKLRQDTQTPVKNP
jgi:phospholipid transport system substrate-binding protein